ncbi:MAG: crossover junction endodeoxyribonuclease RuvC [Flavobacteriales bacterium]|nr:crossover junction endodeoxyribonuclease RuvC [Flavobacteriales bacterium]
MTTDKVILGIDPGTVIMGYGLIHIQGKEMKVLTMGVIKLDKMKDHPTRLKKIFDRTVEIIREYHPDEMSIEAPFFGKNVQSMLKLGRAQGVAIAAALSQNIPIAEYSPRKIKQSVTGNGNASKEQVSSMLETLLNTKLDGITLDATDGLAAAVCHHFNSSGRSSSSKAYSGWASFLKENPDRKA